MGKSYKKNELRNVDRGIRYEVSAFKSKKDIEKIKQFLMGKQNKRDYALFVLGINVGLRAQDLVELRVGDISNGRQTIAKKVQVIEQKTLKIREFEINKVAADALKVYLGSLPTYNEDAWLFPSRKGSDHITVDCVRDIIKLTCKELNIKGNYGAHSLRKTFGYWVFVNNTQKNPLVLVTLQKIFNHTTQATTLRYIGIDSAEISNIYQTLNI